MSKSVIEHVLSRLRDIGIKDVFGVAGDFAFPINDAVSANKERWIGSCNELNAAPTCTAKFRGSRRGFSETKQSLSIAVIDHVAMR